VDVLFLIGCCLLIVGALIALLVRPLKRALTLYVVALVSGLLLNITFSLIQIFALPTVNPLFSIFPQISLLFRADGLALYFLLVITTAAVPAVIAAHSYLQHYVHKEPAVRAFLVFFSIMFFSTQLLVLANHAIVFLVFWELMALMAYLGMLLEKEKEEVQKGSLIYFVATHIATFFLYIFFFLLHSQSGNWLFTSFHFTVNNGLLFYAVCLFGFLGFGIKAGFMPFHFWLPMAHPIAPTVLSAFLSGVILKTGIYGIFRLIEFCSPLPAWMGIIILAVGLFSAIFGIWNAIAQKDLKRMLAYSSIENIGIIGIGIGLGVLGVSYSIQSLVWLGFGGALFHTFNHAIFKSLLFLGSGVIYQNFHTRDIDRLGGIVHRAPWFAALFLVGSVAICGIPPLNGFMSEFLIYKGFLESASILGKYFPLFMLLMSVGLAFVGGLALAGFTKINGIMFLGTARTHHTTFKVAFTDYLALGILSVLCIIFGVYPQSLLGIISSVITFNHWGVVLQPYTMFAQWGVFSLVFLSVLITIGFLLLWKKLTLQQRVSPAWGCGYALQTPRMQYSSTSFSDEMVNIAGTVLNVHKRIRLPLSLFPNKSLYHTSMHDLVLYKIIKPIISALIWTTDRFKWLQVGKVQVYVTFSIVVLLLYLLLALFI
jgi:hydrogenase-4 component B